MRHPPQFDDVSRADMRHPPNLDDVSGPRLKDKVALITGAGSGIGRESAILFAREGASVVAVDLNPDTAVHVAEQIRTEGGEAIAVQADVSITADAERMIQAAEAKFGRLNVLF